MFCRYCGYKLENNWKFCPVCNAAIGAGTAVSSEPKGDTKSEPPIPPKTPGVEAYYKEQAIQPPRYMPPAGQTVPYRPQMQQMTQMQQAPRAQQMPYPQQYNAAAAGAQKPQDNKTKLIIALSAGVVAMIVGIFLVFLSCSGGKSGNSASGCGSALKDPKQSLLESYVRAVESGDKDRIINLYHDNMMNYLWVTPERALDDYDYYYEDHLGEEVLSYEIIDTDGADSYAGELLLDAYGLFGINVTDAVAYRVEIEFNDYTDYLDIAIIKVGNKWYVCSTE